MPKSNGMLKLAAGKSKAWEKSPRKRGGTKLDSAQRDGATSGDSATQEEAEVSPQSDDPPPTTSHPEDAPKALPPALPPAAAKPPAKPAALPPAAAAKPPALPPAAAKHANRSHNQDVLDAACGVFSPTVVPRLLIGVVAASTPTNIALARQNILSLREMYPVEWSFSLLDANAEKWGELTTMDHVHVHPHNITDILRRHGIRTGHLHDSSDAMLGMGPTCVEAIHAVHNGPCSVCLADPRGGSCAKCWRAGFDCTCACGPRTNSFVGKLIFWRSVLRDVRSRHEALWLVDADISFTHFAMDRFYCAWRCAFRGGSPLLAQPVVRQPTQDFWPFRADSWRVGKLSSWRALRLPFLEQQVTVADPGFMTWFVRALEERSFGGESFIDRYMSLRTDWGVDGTWCGAAREYADRVLNQTERVDCALIIEPIDHVDYGTIKKDMEFWDGGQKMHDWVATHLSQWWVGRELHLEFLVGSNTHKALLDLGPLDRFTPSMRRRMALAQARGPASQCLSSTAMTADQAGLPSQDM